MDRFFCFCGRYGFSILQCFLTADTRDVIAIGPFARREARLGLK